MSTKSARSIEVAVGTLLAGTVFAAPALAHDRYEYAELADSVSPAVVNIFTSTAPIAREEQQPGRELPKAFRDFMERFGIPEMPGMPGMPPGGTPGPRNALGSGFVMDAEGYVITNNHVVEGADEVKVRFADDREFPAEVVGLDAATDLAVLKIEADGALPFVTLGDSDTLRVGEEVMAVGNPFGLGGTVTTGIVSAKGRDINAGPYVDFIQTDAAINRGNSGGPLFNLDGEVVGVNSAIYSPTGTNVGVGFAIPSNLVDMVVADLKEDGEVDRGWLGVQIQGVTDEIAAALGLEEARGTLVADVFSDSPSEGKLQAGDVILEYDGQEVTETRDLPKLVAATEAGETVRMLVWREGASETVKITIGELDPERMAAAPAARPASDGDTSSSEELGAELAELDGQTAESIGLDEDAGGVVVTSVERGGVAEKGGLVAGDVILQVGETPVADPAEVSAALDGLESDAALLKVNRGGSVIFVGVRLADA